MGRTPISIDPAKVRTLMSVKGSTVKSVAREIGVSRNTLQSRLKDTTTLREAADNGKQSQQREKSLHSLIQESVELAETELRERIVEAVKIDERIDVILDAIPKLCRAEKLEVPEFTRKVLAHRLKYRAGSRKARIALLEILKSAQETSSNNERE